VAKVRRQLVVVRGYSGDGAQMAFVHLVDSGTQAVARGGVDIAILTAHHQTVDLVGREGHRCDGNGLRLALLQLERVLRLRQHVQRPGAQLAVRGYGDDIVRILGAHHLEAVDGMRVRRGAEWRTLDGRALLDAIVPQHNLARIGAAEDQVGIELGKAGGHHRALTVEDILGRGLLELGVPHHHHAVRLIGALLVVVIGGHHQLREVGGPVHAGDATIL